MFAARQRCWPVRSNDEFGCLCSGNMTGLNPSKSAEAAMSYESAMREKIDQIVDAAIESDMACHAFYGNLQDGFDGPALSTEANPSYYMDVHIAPDGRATDEYGQVYRHGDPYFAISFDPVETMARWREEIPQAFDVWLDIPDPAVLEGKVESARSAARTLALSGSTDGEGADAVLMPGNVQLSGDLDYLSAELGQFNGATVNAFHRNYVSQMPIVISNQWAAAVVLGIGITAEHEIWKRARQDLLDIADKVLEAMKDAHGSGGGGFDLFLKIAGAALSAVGLFVAGPAGAVVGGVNTALGILGRFLPTDGAENPEVGFGARDPAGVLEKLVEGLDAVNRVIFEEEHQMRTCVMNARFEIYDDAFDLARPSDLLSESDVGDIVTADETDVRLDTLRNIGNVVMPAIAGQLTSAATQVDAAAGEGAWTRQAQLGLGSRGYYFEWGGMQEMLSRLLLDTAWEVQEAGRHLTLAAGDLGQTDEDIGAALAQHGQRVAGGSPISQSSALEGRPLR